MSIPLQSECRNALLRRMSPKDFDHLTPRAHLVDLKRGEVLCDSGEAQVDVFFPETGMASVTSRVAPMEIEIGFIGREGFVGVPVLLGAESGPSSVFVQQAGTFIRVSTLAFLEAVEASRELSKLLHRYVHAYIVQISSTVVAGSTLNLEERLARWLLMAHDRSDEHDLPLTHEFLSMMLGVRRPGVTEATHILEGEHAIKATRGHINVLSRDKLKVHAQGCYGSAEAEYERVIGPVEA